MTPPSSDPTPPSSDPTGPDFALRTTAWRRVVRRRPGLAAVGLLAALLIGVALGRSTVPTPRVEAARVLEEQVLPLVGDADGIWTASSGDRPPVSEALVALRRDHDVTAVQIGGDAWLSAYDSVLARLAGLDLPAEARPVQRQFIAAVALSRDAVEVMIRAAGLEPGDARRDLMTEIGRLRTRSEQMTQSARASVDDLGGKRSGVAPLSPVTPFEEGR